MHSIVGGSFFIEACEKKGFMVTVLQLCNKQSSQGNIDIYLFGLRNTTHAFWYVTFIFIY